MKLSESRGPNIDTEKCVEQAGGNRFDLVLIASVRARELARRHKAAELTTQVNAPVSALLDIQEGKIGPEYLKKVD
jgi:DNA-directed RNA polymerase omega subunit